MNRPLIVRDGAANVVLVAMPARAQAPLVVGSVRDQHGVAVAGAVVAGVEASKRLSVRRPTRPGPSRSTEAGVVSVRITCRYCGPERSSR